MWIDDCTFFSLTFFQLICYFSGYRRIRDIAAHRLVFYPPPSPPTCIYYNKALTKKERWESNTYWWFFSCFSHLVSINFLFSGLSRVPWYRSRQMDFHPAAAIACSRLLKQGGHAKRMVRSHCVLMKWQFINSPFFQFNWYLLGQRAIGDITAHMLNFGLPRPLPLIDVHYKALYCWFIKL